MCSSTVSAAHPSAAHPHYGPNGEGQACEWWAHSATGQGGHGAETHALRWLRTPSSTWPRKLGLSSASKWGLAEVLCNHEMRQKNHRITVLWKVMGRNCINRKPWLKQFQERKRWWQTTPGSIYHPHCPLHCMNSVSTFPPRNPELTKDVSRWTFWTREKYVYTRGSNNPIKKQTTEENTAPSRSRGPPLHLLPSRADSVTWLWVTRLEVNRRIQTCAGTNLYWV